MIPKEQRYYNVIQSFYLVFRYSCNLEKKHFIVRQYHPLNIIFLPLYLDHLFLTKDGLQPQELKTKQ